ncbi:MAG TPA: 3-hydroxyacyl-CoA dehydrogenase family protein [Negativicutes bacterium]|nr:3-hydroxyacyl-CoA dehydrogenase family protein [Negativicutes bacterium]
MRKKVILMKATDIGKVACVGGGLIGASWALNFAMKGYPVNLFDISPAAIETAKANIRKNFEVLQANGILDKKACIDAETLISYTTSLGEAVREVQFIQEAGPENYEAKQKILAEIEKFTPATTIIASSTSGLLISEIAKFAAHPERCIGAHPYNPPHIIPLVEITKGAKSSEEAVRCAYDFYTALGKEPVVLQKEALGFIANRIQIALYREAVNLVERGICTVEDVDKAITFGPGLRWAVMGPNLLFQLGGGPHGIKGLLTHMGPSTELWMADMATWNTYPPGWYDKAQEGVNREMANRPAEFGRTPEEIAAFRDRLMLEILKLHKKL